MSRRTYLMLISLLLCLLLGPSDPTRAQNRESVTIRPAPAFSGETLAALPTTDWLTNGGNLFNQRYSPLTEIDRTNVGGLKGVWRTHLDGSGAAPRNSGEAHPIVHNGVIYTVTGDDDVFAISVESGRILWKYRALLDETIDTVCCGWTSRGLGLGEGKVYLGQLDGKLVAVDQVSGDVAWATQAQRWQDGYMITSAPLYFDGLVITGFAGAERATRGQVKAYDAADGSLVWTFYTIPAPGEPGHETWPAGSDVWRYGGGTVWQTPAVDPELGLIYFYTANANPDFNGSVRAGDNLFTSSIVALEAATGQYRWHFQTVHHDLWDFDGANPVVLFDAEIGGQERKGLAAAGKTGWVYILDRTNGEPLIGIEERAVPQEERQATAATQPYPVGDAFVPQQVDIAPEGYALVNGGRIFTPFWTDPVALKPSFLGGANWPPSSYDPETQTLYVCAIDRIDIFAAGEVEEETEEGDWRTGGEFASASIPATGIFAALDMKTNRLRWRQRWSETCYSGSATTAGGLVFVGRNDGRFTALDSADGSLLWEFQTGAGVNAPPTVFEHDGKQYVLVYSAGNLLARTARGDSMWLFGLDGTLDPAEAPRAGAGAEVAAAAPPEDREPDPDQGRLVYTQTCVFCHGNQGEGGHEGVPLTAITDAQSIRRIVIEGRNRMPAFGALLTPEQIQDLVAFVTDRLPNQLR